MTVEQILQKEIEESRTWLDQENEESTYKRDLHKRIELMGPALIIGHVRGHSSNLFYNLLSYIIFNIIFRCYVSRWDYYRPLSRTDLIPSVYFKDLEN